MTKKRLRKIRTARIRAQERADSYVKPEPHSQSDLYRFGVLKKR